MIVTISFIQELKELKTKIKFKGGLVMDSIIYGLEVAEKVLQPLAYVSYAILGYSSIWCINYKVKEWRKKHGKK